MAVTLTARERSHLPRPSARLSSIVARHGALNAQAVEAVCHEVLCGLRYLHEEKHTIHRDIKVKKGSHG